MKISYFLCNDVMDYTILFDISNLTATFNILKRLKDLSSWQFALTVKRPQPGPPEDFQPIRNRSLNKKMNMRTSRETVKIFLIG